MKHIMKINDKAFERMKNGQKLREYRVNDEKRQKVKIGDVIEFQKLSNLEDKILMEVKEIELFKTLDVAITYHFKEDFSDRHENVDSTVNSFYQKGFCTKEEIEKYGLVVFKIEKYRVAHYNSTVCYLKKDNKILMIKFSKKWGNVYAPPGGKFEEGETPLDCIIREFKEETGLTLINPKLQGLSYWKDSKEGIIFIYTAEDYEGDLILNSEEGILEWVNFEDFAKVPQFEQNGKFSSYLFKSKLFEGKFILDDTCKVLKYEIRDI
ncbi:MAG: NUDIX domain-containing protein [Bacilli bacterium]|nr:NUDIX domain-containing protein [Bacilli bacterium]